MLLDEKEFEKQYEVTHVFVGKLPKNLDKFWEPYEGTNVIPNNYWALEGQFIKETMEHLERKKRKYNET